MERKRKLYKTYTREFKLEAVRLMETSEQPSSEVTRELGIRRYTQDSEIQGTHTQLSKDK